MDSKVTLAGSVSTADTVFGSRPASRATWAWVSRCSLRKPRRTWASCPRVETVNSLRPAAIPWKVYHEIIPHGVYHRLYPMGYTSEIYPAGYAAVQGSVALDRFCGSRDARCTQ